MKVKLNKNPDKKGNIRAYANITHLICLSNLENLNAHLFNNQLAKKKDFEN